jgi:hypothetical protein
MDLGPGPGLFDQGKREGVRARLWVRVETKPVIVDYE